ncbi:MAG: hypothetical protein M3O80_00165 [Chloroflexota bacterium]|nr:hypothetical protein [Chloroflexota bacterium]
MTPAATAWSCEAAHFGTPVGSAVGEDLTVAVGGAVTITGDRVAVGTGESVAVTLVGPAQDTSTAASTKRSIARR